MLRLDTTRELEVSRRSRRGEERYRVAATVSFKWRSEHGDWREGRGITRDISGGGLFILAYPVPVPGSQIVVVVQIPSLSPAKIPIVFQGYGTVVRIEPREGQPVGFAASVLFNDESEPSAAND